MKLFTDGDADLSLIRGRRVAVIGYGNQGRAQALNLRDSGAPPIVALREGAPSRARAEADGFEVATPEDAAARCDVAAVLTPDDGQAEIWETALKPNLPQGAALVFAHGLSIRFGLISPRPDLDIVLVAPKGPGSALRSEYEAGRGLVTLFAVHQDATGAAEALALSYAAALGSGRAGILPTSFAEECEADLFNEQAVLWGAIPELIHAGYETLVDAGFSPEVAYFECLTEVKLIADLIYARGIAGMREAISNTAEFGALQGGRRIVTPETRAEMRHILAEVRNGSFVAELMADASAGYPKLRASRREASSHPIEEVGRKLREIRPN
ncbi:MAG: ketol-acid reductoisomerase [Allosphingosinicella sp.]|uniref:ketol-acid reductoisomerase n=1 Tax=Allosphingosinicella sp. TaxID=2823234 RepID=UPI00393249E1